ncbi:MAG: amino acid ABC transporter permease, partial [Bacilli bacterium]
KVSRFAPLRWFANGYTLVFRGTPMTIQLMIIYFGVPQIIGMDISAFVAGFIGLGLNSGAYVSEIVRAGIQSIDRGQTEAALALGLDRTTTMRKIIFPQAFKNIVPALVNEWITLIKDTSLVTVIALSDVTRRAYIVGGDTFRFLEALLVAGAIYFVLVSVLTIIGKMLERRLAQ